MRIPGEYVAPWWLVAPRAEGDADAAMARRVAEIEAGCQRQLDEEREAFLASRGEGD